MSLVVSSQTAHTESDTNKKETTSLLFYYDNTEHSDSNPFKTMCFVTIFVCTPSEAQMKRSRSFGHEGPDFTILICIASEAWHEGLPCAFCAESRIPLVSPS